MGIAIPVATVIMFIQINHVVHYIKKVMVACSIPEGLFFSQFKVIFDDRNDSV